MTLRIEKDSVGSTTTIRLMGRIRSEHLPELKEQLATAGPTVVLDLDEVTLVDVEAVRFLGACEAKGAEVLRCSPYIREWMLREMSKEKRLVVRRDQVRG
jgi:anti-anti-sigma regulatory factor